MGRIAGGSFDFDFQGTTGALAIALMLGYAAWATIVHAGRKPGPKASFQWYSIAVRAVWLVPYLSGPAFGAGIGR